MYKVFIDDNVFYLIFNVNEALFFSEVNIVEPLDIEELILLCSKSSMPVIVNFSSTKKLKKYLKNNFTVVTAGGGAVFNNKNELLMIKRHGKWDLPKGKIEANEKKKEGAIREVEEECGISNPIIEKWLCNTYHTYTRNNKLCLKESIWYKMKYNGNEKLLPQIEEDITDVKWISANELEVYAKASFSSIQDVIKKLQ